MLPPMTAIATSPARRRAVQDARLAARAQGQCEPDQDDGRHAVLGGRVDRRVRHELDTGGIEIDGESADGCGAEREQDPSLAPAKVRGPITAPSLPDAGRSSPARSIFVRECLVEQLPDDPRLIGIDDLQHGAGGDDDPVAHRDLGNEHRRWRAASVRAISTSAQAIGDLEDLSGVGHAHGSPTRCDGRRRAVSDLGHRDSPSWSTRVSSAGATHERIVAM